MKINNLLQESFECVKIGNVYRNLNTDELKVYKQAKKEGKIYKQDLPEYEQNVATTMVSKGLLRRKKEKETGKIYYSTVGRNGRIKTKELDEVAPPDREIESWIKKNKKTFQDRYGDGYEKYLYGKAWKKYNGKPIKESKEMDEEDIQMSIGDKCINTKDDKVGKIVSINIKNVDGKKFEVVGVKDFDTDEKTYIKISEFKDDWKIIPTDTDI